MKTNDFFANAGRPLGSTRRQVEKAFGNSQPNDQRRLGGEDLTGFANFAFGFFVQRKNSCVILDAASTGFSAQSFVRQRYTAKFVKGKIGFQTGAFALHQSQRIF